MTTTVSGRTYRHTRPRGFADWNPRPDTFRLVEQVLSVLDEYSEHLPLTARQVFYRLVGAHGFDKTEQAYSRLCEYINRARRARLIPMNAIRDDGTTAIPPRGFSDPAEFWAAVQHTADTYTRQLDHGQPVHVELWVEAQGMVPQVARVARDFGAHVYSSGGFDSTTAKHEAAERMASRDKPTVIVHVGDYDPSGLSILDSRAEDINAFVHGMDGIDPSWQVAAVTAAQIRRYDLPTAPQKTTDRRGEQMADTVQCEALTPGQLRTVLLDALAPLTDWDQQHIARRTSEQERAQILDALAGLRNDQTGDQE